MKKRLLSWLMALTLCLALLPAAALANGNGVEDLQLTGEQETILSGEEGNAAPGEQQETQLAEGALLPAAAPAAEPAALMASGLFTQAAGHDHCLCGAAHKAIGDHTDANASQITFTEWTDALAEQQNGSGKTAANSLPKVGNGYYYLTQDVVLRTSWRPADGTVLCLNGHSIKGGGSNGAIMVDKGVNFTLCDCNGSNKTYHFADGEYGQPWTQDESGSHEVTGGIITSNYSAVTVTAKSTDKGGTFNLYGGTIVGNRGYEGKRGGGVYVGFNGSNNTFNMYGGAIVGNSVSGSDTTDGGGGVYVTGENNTFNMYGGEISGNATTRHASGGGVNVNYKGTFNMTGGVIGGEGKGNISRSGGGGVYVHEQSVFNMSGSARITDNKETYGAGGGVQVNSGTFTMSGDAKIVNNQTTGTNGIGGGGVSVSENSSFTMSGNAAITGNSSSGNGGGVSVRGNTLIVSGNVQITGNTKNNKANNVYLGQYNNDPMATITIGEEYLDTNAKIGVTAKTPSAGLVIATGATENKNYTEIFTSDDDTYEVAHDSTDATKLVLKVAPEKPHEHFLCGNDPCTCPVTEAGKVIFQPWASTTSLPNTAGNYYLTGNVTLVDSYWTPADGTVLCLNGYSITRNRTITTGYVQNYGVINITGSFTLADCKGKQDEYGKITHGKDADNNTYPGRGVSVHSGSFTMYGGNITGNKTSDSTWGSGVFVGNFGGNKGSFTMYGGKISGNTAPQGGGVYVRDNFTMYGGEISGNEANYSGGGVVVENGGTFTMKNGTISDNAVNGTGGTYYGGGGVDVNYGGTFTMEGGTISGNKYQGTQGSYVGGGGVHVRGNTNPKESYTPFIMKGGTISDNETNFTGGGVYVGENTTFTMEGGTISNNKAATVGPNRSGGGGGVYAYGSFTMTGGEISGNNCDSGEYFYGGGVYVVELDDDAAMTVSGNVKITGNTQSSGSDSTASNVYLPSGKTITIGGALTGEAGSIGVTTSAVPTEKRPVTIATAGSNYTITESVKDKFASDKEGYKITYYDNTLRLAKIAALTRIAVPTAKTGLIYNGEQQTGVVSGTGYTITGNTATNAGSYTATAALKSGYTWNDGSNDAKTISWSIAKKAPAAADFTFTAPTDLVYNGSARTAEVAAMSGINGMGEVTTVKYYQGETAVQPINAGVYTVKIDVAEGTNYTDAKNLTTDDWTFTIISGGEVVPPAHTHTYGAWSSDAANHWHECTDASCTDKPGSIKDTAAHVYGGADDATCNVCGYTRELTPPSAVPVTGITLNITSAALKVGETVTLTAAVEPSNATNGNVTWASSDSAVAAVSNGVVTAVKEGAAVITATAADDSGIFASCTVTVTAAPAPGGSTGGDFVPGGEISSTVTTKTNPDGSVTRTETKSDGTVIETTSNPDGSTTRTTVRKDGSSVIESREANGTTGTVRTDTIGKTEAEAKVSEKAIEDAKKSGETVKVPVEVRAGENSDTAPTVKVELPRNAGETEIEISVAGVSSGTVAVIVHPDGTEEIVKASKPTENGIQLAVNGSTTIKIIDNSKDFIDTRSHWSRDEVNFVVSRELFNGVGNNLFGVKQTMTRGMVNTVLARFAGVDTTPKAGQKWYEVGTEWAKANGISDGTNPEASVTREQLATLLYRFSGSPAVSGSLNFTDAREVRDYAQNALLWATQNGIINGVGGGRIAPGTDAQRAQVAAMMARYLKNL